MENEKTKVNMDSHSTVINLCNWDIYFSLLGANGGDIMIQKNGSRDLLNRDIVSLCNNNNIFFTGVDNKGSHARVYIENPDLRVYVGFDSEDGKTKQNILTDEKCDYIFNLKTQKSFEENVKKEVITEAEKDKIISYARKVKLNDFDKIYFLEQHTNKKFRL